MNYSLSRLIRLSAYSMLLLMQPELCCTIAYIPQTLKHCIQETKHLRNSYTSSLQDLSVIIAENRVLSSEDLMRQATIDMLNLVKAYKNAFNEKQRKTIKNYLSEYLKSLKSKHILLATRSSSATTSWPASFLAYALERDGLNFDIIQLNNEKRADENLVLCGDISNNIRSPFNKKEVAHIQRKINSELFNANEMTNVQSTTPTIVFGTGVTSPVINAWIMTPSTTTQSPINIEFAIPENLKEKKPTTLELHFLVQQNGANDGKARLQINAKYIHSGSSFDIFDATPDYSKTYFSSNFSVSEPSNANSVKHIVVTIDLTSSSIKPNDLALLSIFRVDPTSGTEYNSDIYLAAAAFQYTE